MSVVTASERLSAAFEARDLAAALACFVPGDDIGYAGSEQSEQATGRDGVAALLTTVFARDEAYSWRVTTAMVREYGTAAYLYAQADGLVHSDVGEAVPFAYRISGVLEPLAGQWLWRHCYGCEPTRDA